MPIHAYIPVAVTRPGNPFHKVKKKAGVEPFTGDRPIANLILRAVSSGTLKPLSLHLQPVELKRGMVLHQAGSPVKRLYFINHGMVSCVTTMKDGRTVEVSAIGVEGMTTSEVLFGANAAILDGIVRIPGSAFMIERSDLADAMGNDRSLKNLLQDYLHLSMQRLAQTAACSRLHSLEQRCCRWLLIAHDSVRTTDFPLTHEVLAMMLGVHRPGASIAMKTLQKAGFVRYTRGNVSVVDRSGLEDFACECYATIQRESRAMFLRMQ